MGFVCFAISLMFVGICLENCSVCILYEIFFHFEFMLFLLIKITKIRKINFDKECS